MTMLSIYTDVLQLLDLLIVPRIPWQQDSDLTTGTQDISVMPRSETQQSPTPSPAFTLLQHITELYKAFIQIAKDMPSFLLG